jgi:hypothetical protein
LGLTAHVQSLSAFEHAFCPPVRRQIPPGTSLPWFWAQTPRGAPLTDVEDSRHVTVPVSEPQHWLESVQRLFRILQPRPGWQTLTPVSAQGPQFLLQQLPQPLQMTPSCWQEPAPVVAMSWQVPSAAPEAFEQYPPQQSESRPQTSPG